LVLLVICRRLCYICASMVRAPGRKQPMNYMEDTVNRLLRCASALLLLLAVSGCAQNYYNIPRETYEKKVRILGVAPLMVDAGSDIRHQEKDAIVALLKEANRANEKELVAQLRATGTYFAVRLLDTDADQLFQSLFERRERRDDAGVVYNKHFYKPAEIKAILEKNGLDGLMLVTVSGMMKKDKVYSRNLFAFLDTDYNVLSMSAQILDKEATLLWEYPNFKLRSLNFPTFLSLQYPDFDEADANVTDTVDVKTKTVAGIRRALLKSEAGKPVTAPVYQTIFEDMASLQKPELSLFGTAKKPEPAKPAAAQ